MKITHKRTTLNHAAIRRAFDNAKTDAVFYRTLVRIKGHAIAIAVSRIKHTHPVTLPAYIASFKIHRVRRRWRLTNTDPAAFWVEFGAYIHDVNHPRILRYRPIGLAKDIVASGG